MKAFDIKDGYMIARLSSYGIIPIIITGRKSEILLKRCKELNIHELHQEVHEKLNCLTHIFKSHKLNLTETADIGDDNDKEMYRSLWLYRLPSRCLRIHRLYLSYQRR